MPRKTTNIAFNLDIMTYEDLCAWVADADPADLTPDALRSKGGRNIRLLRTYLNALDNPPEGVVGVGAITYAEDALRSAQVADQGDS